ncbi:DUF1684 domain-containing protein [Haloferacaceae archaeon DSL9]
MSASFDAGRWAEQVAENRREKDEFFETHPQSPIPPAKRDDFGGLSYFAPDPEYRVTATVTARDDPEPIELETTAGPNVRYVRLARFAFEIDGGRELAAYRHTTDDGKTLFVPFRDKTTGQQTYRRGRYMELEAQRGPEDGDEIVLDFNLAYNPFCAYSETFSCPLPPEENWLDVEIRAGERV